MKALQILSIFLIIGCTGSKEEEWTKLYMSELIYDKTDLRLDTAFLVHVDSVYQTPEAFDLDYTYFLTLEYEQSDELNLTSQIMESEHFNVIKYQNYGDSIWQRIHSDSLKGIWITSNKGFKYLYSQLEQWEPFVFEIDTASNTVSLRLTHL